MAELTRARIELAPLVAAATRPECGAVNIFLGTTRDHHAGRRVLRLEYDVRFTPQKNEGFWTVNVGVAIGAGR